MKTISYLILLSAILFCSFTHQFVLTGLKVTVRNELGNLESGVKVSLYTTKDDYEKSVNAVATQVTDEKGNAVFDKLSAIKYYVGAEKGDKNNFGAGEETDVLTANRQNRVTIIISD